MARCCGGADAVSTPISVRTLLHQGGELAEELVHHLLGRCFHQAGADGRNQTADESVGGAAQFGGWALLDQLHVGGALDKTGRAFAFDDQSVGLRRSQIVELDLADVTAFETRQPDLEVGVVGVFARLDHLFAAVDGLLQDCWVDDGGEDLVAGGRDAVRTAESHLGLKVSIIWRYSGNARSEAKRWSLAAVL